MKDRNGLPLELGNDVRTPGGVGRVSSFSLWNSEICVRHYKEGSVVFTNRPVSYPVADVELLGQSLQQKLREENFCK